MSEVGSWQTSKDQSSKLWVRSLPPDEALSVLRYTIGPQIAADDKKKPWIWMEKRAHYTDTTGSSLLTDRFKFWTSSQALHGSIQEWEVKVRQVSSLCAYVDLTDELKTPTHDSRQSGLWHYPPTQSRDLHYTDMYGRDDQQ